MLEVEKTAKVLEEPETTKAPEPTQTDSEPSLLFLTDWFELSATDRMNVENQERINFIYDYTKGQVGSDVMKTYQLLRDISYRLGVPRIGQSKLQQIYQWIKIQNQKQVLNMKEEELRGN